MKDPKGRRRILILAQGLFGVLDAKTASCVIRYRGDEVVAVLDSANAGRDASELIGIGAGIPVVGTLEEGLALEPDTLLVGVAPRGGRLPEAWRSMILSALAEGLEVVSGLHTFLSDDPELAAAAAAGGGRIWDVRRVPEDLPVASRLAAGVDAVVVLTVGSDCNVGKMTAAMELTLGARRRGRKAVFAPTGQTGLFIEGWGIVVDRVIADFVAGAAERIVLENAPGADLVFVEGQGSILHPGYSGVTLALLHGSMPDAQVLVHQPTRERSLNDEIPIPPLPELIRAYESAAAWLKPAPVVGIALNCYDVDDRAAREFGRRIEAETGLPTVDPVRFGADALLEPILSLRKARVAPQGSGAPESAPAPEPRGTPELRRESGRPAGQAGVGRRG
jgi:uncharacterized NAD-dependent epimerase/dehydratase family protein